MTKKQRKELAKARLNHLALHAFNRNGAGKRPDKRKVKAKKACREKIKW